MGNYDFIGFSFDGIDSEDLGIVRVSGGDRYEEQLFPEIKDITAEVPGMDGEYYFGSTYGTRTFDLEIAYDSLTEEQFRKLRTIFGDKKIHKLVFHERPYKYYLVKLESPIELSYVCFDEPDYVWKRIMVESSGMTSVVSEEADANADYLLNISQEPYEYKEYTGTTRRVYKGEGKLSFICHYPFAKSVYKQLPFSYELTQDESVNVTKKYYELNDSEYELVTPQEGDNPKNQGWYEKIIEGSDWAVSSGILSDDDYVRYDTYSAGKIEIYNPGDLPTGFRLYISFDSIPSTSDNEDEFIRIDYNIDDEIVYSLLIYYPITPKNNDEGILVDTNNNLITGVVDFNSEDKTYTTTGNLYNEYIKAGFLFKIQPIKADEDHAIQFTGLVDDNVEIFYDYLYF